MTHDAEKALRALRSLGISDTEFSRIRASLVAYSDLHAVPARASALPAQSLFMRIISSQRSVYAFGLMLLVVAGGSGISFAAERTIPGDALYPIKVGVNETVAATFAADGEAKAVHSAKLAERRADEAIQLADSGRLDAGTAVYLSEQFALHAARADAEADELEAAGDISASLKARAELATRIARKAAAFESAVLATADIDSAGVSGDEAIDTAIASTALADTLEIGEEAATLASEHAQAALLPGIAAVVDGELDLTGVKNAKQGAQAVMMAATSSSLENRTLEVKAINYGGGTQRVDIEAASDGSSWSRTIENSGQPLFLRVGL
ncbi:MAG TPA: DUF5667 domain-containing protein [Candidatus Paceibacterota bacterium]|nr:DUF5667 domain-containing protein [Candidatus Paceibacterota bacterium]